VTSDEYVHGAGRLLLLSCALSRGQWTGEEEDGIWRARDGSDSGLAAPNQPLALSRGGEGRRKEKVRRRGQAKRKKACQHQQPVRASRGGQSVYRHSKVQLSVFLYFFPSFFSLL